MVVERVFDDLVLIGVYMIAWIACSCIYDCLDHMFCMLQYVYMMCTCIWHDVYYSFLDIVFVVICR